MTLSRRKVARCVLAFSLALLLLGICFFRHVAADQLQRWKVLPRPERFTELYFTNPTAMPHFVEGQSQSVSFTIHNVERQATRYHYQLFSRTQTGDEQVLGGGYTQLSNNELHNVVITITIPTISKRLALEVRIAYTGVPFGRDTSQVETQTIHYWVN